MRVVRSPDWTPGTTLDRKSMRWVMKRPLAQTVDLIPSLIALDFAGFRKPKQTAKDLQFTRNQWRQLLNPRLKLDLEPIAPFIHHPPSGTCAFRLLETRPIAHQRLLPPERLDGGGCGTSRWSYLVTLVIACGVSPGIWDVSASTPTRASESPRPIPRFPGNTHPRTCFTDGGTLSLEADRLGFVCPRDQAVYNTV